MSKPCESTCEKCGSNDIALSFHAKDELLRSDKYGRCRNRFGASNGAYGIRVFRDHISYNCRTCQFKWQGLPMPKPRKTKPADSPQEASDASKAPEALKGGEDERG